MQIRRLISITFVSLLVTSCISSMTMAENSIQEKEAHKILNTTGFKGGLIVHLGCGDGKLTVALLANDSCLVHGLGEDARDVDQARKYIESLGLSGKISVDSFDGQNLPYIDNLVNLVVAEDPGKVPLTEVMRVLVPKGVAYIGYGGKWKKIVKPWPANIDEWTHFLHDASGNAVSQDQIAGPPRRMQWLAAPQWCRNHHKLASISSVVSAKGKLFYIVDEATAGTMLVPGRWLLVARDAFNGILLWKQPISSWAWERHGFRSGPVQLPRLLVANEGRVYIPLGMNQAVSSLDMATGNIIITYEQTKCAEEIILNDGVLLTVKGKPIAEQAGIHPNMRGRKFFTNTKSIVAIKAETGDELWTWIENESELLMPLTLAAKGGRVLFQAGDEIKCMDLKNGKVLWCTPPGIQKKEASRQVSENDKKKSRKAKIKKWKRKVGWSTSTLVIDDEIVLWANAGNLKALSARDGNQIWECPCKEGFKSPTDIFIANGLVWLGPDYNVGRNLRTGEVKRRLLELDDLRTVGHHHRCYREKATNRYIIGGYRGMEFFDLVGNNHSRNNWVRGTCQYGILPSNGLVYAPSHACGCYMEAKLYGFWALASEGKHDIKIERNLRLQKGPAYIEKSSQSTGSAIHTAQEWPTYRHDILRSGSTPSTVPSSLQQTWRVKVAGDISQPVVAEGTVLISAIDEHRVVALTADDGSSRWTFTAGGRVDSPPTIYGDLVLFGSANGYVYCLRLKDGKLIWRFRASPRDLRTIAFDQVESVWPVHGSVLVLNGIAYVTAGRSSYLDGGIFMYGLEPSTGKVLYEKCVSSEHPRADEGKKGPAEMNAKLTQNATDPKTFQAPDLSDAFSMKGGTTSDVLVSDGKSLFLRTFRFNKECVQQERSARHLFSTSGLLDGNENHRSHLLVGTGDFSRIPVAYSWIANRGGAYKSHVAVPYGLTLAFDDDSVWGVRRLKGYTLFADVHESLTGDDDERPDLRSLTQNFKSTWKWSKVVNMRPRAIVRAGNLLLLGGMSTLSEKENSPEALAGFEGRGTGQLWLMSTRDGAKVNEITLEAPPTWDGMAVANGRLYVSKVDGTLECFSDK
ncbi:MAG: PQQ-binding-like beta-propeller repeat protein [Phycisphaerae bacterium]|nr:PQQ-binding-like beta-propeller repeat protein [Phycisphaerae bacterium]NIS52112.1 PQQ-binding-like beta-propeller repeat protein [Phycisphaerae bacterium]NIU09655.1 PQQ-binding-like beta-propeller repeat protein [Phycisphaerae bacterium]NIU57345.1 PQQ-binding-like beta-propeller repeat protein [Phycisphaerae bacterium]NIW93779.1 PQQ-binding-like beta-propeller repeat protein [Phycisphaerae bacterium]